MCINEPEGKYVHILSKLVIFFFSCCVCDRERDDRPMCKCVQHVLKIVCQYLQHEEFLF
jgi:hypothetical protein